MDRDNRKYLHELRIREHTLKANRVASLRGARLEELTGVPDGRTGLFFPYRGCGEGCGRVLFRPDRGGCEEFVAVNGAVGRLYVPAGVPSSLVYPSRALNVVTSEINALALAQIGLPTVSLAPPWRISSGADLDRLLQHIAQFDLDGRQVYLVPPSSAADGFQEQDGEDVGTFGRCLEQRGGDVRLVQLSPEKGGCHGIAKFLAEMTTSRIDPAESWQRLCSKAVSLTPAACSDSRAPGQPNPSTEVVVSPRIREILAQAKARPLLRPGQDFQLGRLVYGVQVGEDPVFVTSDGNAWELSDAKERFRLSTPVATLPDTFRPDAIEQHLAGQSVDLGNVIDRVEAVFRAHLYWREPVLPPVLACWTFGTYVFTLFSTYGYPWFTSVEKRSGKSLALDLLSCVAFHATPRMLRPSPAVLYRDVGEACRTAVLDEVEGLRGKDPHVYSDVIQLLNAGFQAGSVVPRIESVAGGMRTRYFNAYSPKVLAGISDLPDTIEDRAFRIDLWRRRKEDAVVPFDYRSQQAPLADLRDDLYRAGLAYAQEVAGLYGQGDTFDMPKGLDDRARGIFAPLFAVAQLIDSRRMDSTARMSAAIRRFAELQAGLRGAEENLGRAGQVALALIDLPFSSDGTYVVPAAQMLTLLKKAGLVIANTRQASGLLRRLALTSKTHRVRGKVIRGYLIQRPAVEDLVARFVPVEASPDVPGVTPVTTA